MENQITFRNRERGISMNNSTMKWITEDLVGKVLLGVAMVILIGVWIIEFSSIDSDVNNSIMDEYIETLEVQADELMSAVIEFNELYYAGYFDEINALEGMVNAIPFLFRT